MFANSYKTLIAAQKLFTGNTQIINGAGAPTDGVTGAGTSKRFSLYLRTSNNTLYVNDGSLATPRWVAINHP